MGKWVYIYLRVCALLCALLSVGVCSSHVCACMHACPCVHTCQCVNVCVCVCVCMHVSTMHLFVVTSGRDGEKKQTSVILI